MPEPKILKTVFASNIPVECHIVKGRLEAEGIPCFIFDENIVWVDPFKAVAVGGVKLKVSLDDYIEAKKILSLIDQGILNDEDGEYSLDRIFDGEIKRQNEILTIKRRLRNDFTLLNQPLVINTEFASQIEVEEIIKDEKEFQALAEKEFIFSWKQFYYELFDFDRSVFNYLRTKPVEYYLEKEIVEGVDGQSGTLFAGCPKCSSDNTAFGFAIDYKWDVLYLVVSLVLWYPLFLIRKKHHCFDCGNNFTARVREIDRKVKLEK